MFERQSQAQFLQGGVVVRRLLHGSDALVLYPRNVVIDGVHLGVSDLARNFKALNGKGLVERARALDRRTGW